MLKIKKMQSQFSILLLIQHNVHTSAAQSLCISKGVGQRTEILLPHFFKTAGIPEMQVWLYFLTAAK